MTSFAGSWFTSFGPMTLAQEGGRVTGTYGRDGTENIIEGAIDAGRLVFQYREAQEQGTGWFRLRRAGSFAGEYLAEGHARPLPWQGWRDLDGLWDTSLGRIRLMQEPSGSVVGFAEHDAAARLDGRVEGRRLAFTLQAPKLVGHGTLELDAAGYTVDGEWHEDGQPVRVLGGQRVMPRQPLTGWWFWRRTGSARSTTGSSPSATCCASCSRACRGRKCGTAIITTRRACCTGAGSSCSCRSRPSSSSPGTGRRLA
jgi:hypothetical protein